MATLGITGATGLVGGHLAKLALAEGHGVRFLFRSHSASSAELEMLGGVPVHGDLCDSTRLVAFAKGCDAVVHCAASTTSVSAKEMRAANVEGVRTLMNACTSAGVSRFVHVSTPSVLVDGTHQIAVDENYQSIRPPIGLYAKTKLEAEQIVVAECRMEWVIVRPKAVFGEGDRTLLPELLTAIRSGKIARIGGDQVLVGLSPAESVARALLNSAITTGISGKAYHIDNGESVDLWTLVAALRLAVSPGSKTLKTLSFGVCRGLAKVVDSVSALKSGRTDSQQYRVAILGRSQTLDTSRARLELGYLPAISVEKALMKAVAEATDEATARRFAAGLPSDWTTPTRTNSRNSD